MKWTIGNRVACAHFEQKAAYIGLKVGHSTDYQYRHPIEAYIQLLQINTKFLPHAVDRLQEFPPYSGVHCMETSERSVRRHGYHCSYF